MTVKELIEKLQEFDEDHEVLVDTGLSDADLLRPSDVREGAMWNIIIE